MKNSSTSIGALVLMLAVLSCAGDARAQEKAAPSGSRVEIWGAWALATPAAGGRLQVDYEPALLLGGTRLESRTTQTLAIDQAAGNGFDAGANFFFSRAFGLQAAFTRSSVGVTGTEGRYTDRLRYVSMPPPNYTPVEGTYERTSAARTAAGTLTYQSIGFGPVARWTLAGGRIGGTVSGGVSRERFSGEVENIVYTQFVLGGHSTLFPTHHHLILAARENDVTWRPYGAADFHIKAARSLALLAGIRVAFGSRLSIPATASALVDPAEDTWTPDLDDVGVTVGQQPLELAGTRWRLVFGVKVFVG